MSFSSGSGEGESSIQDTEAEEEGRWFQSPKQDVLEETRFVEEMMNLFSDMLNPL